MPQRTSPLSSQTILSSTGKAYPQNLLITPKFRVIPKLTAIVYILVLARITHRVCDGSKLGPDKDSLPIVDQIPVQPGLFPLKHRIVYNLQDLFLSPYRRL